MKLHINIWNTFSGLLFVALLIWSMVAFKGLGMVPTSIPPFDFLLVTLAVFRLTRLIAYDTITQFFRDWFVGAHPESLRGTMGTLVNCSWCVGIWFGLIVPFAYFATPYAWYVILVLALAALGSLLQVFVNLSVGRRVGPPQTHGVHDVYASTVQICDVCGVPAPASHFS